MTPDLGDSAIPTDDYRLFCGDLGNVVNDDILSKAFARFPSFNMARLLLMPIFEGKAIAYSFISTPEVRLSVAFGSGGSQSVPATELHGVSSWLDHDKNHDKDQENEDYNPEKDIVQSEDTSKRAKDAKNKKFTRGPITRLRVNAAAVGKEPRNTGTENEKEVTSSYRAPALKPTCSKVFQQATNGAAPGSVNAYLALRVLRAELLVSDLLDSSWSWYFASTVCWDVGIWY